MSPTSLMSRKIKYTNNCTFGIYLQSLFFILTFDFCLLIAEEEFHLLIKLILIILLTNIFLLRKIIALFLQTVYYSTSNMLHFQKTENLVIARGLSTYITLHRAVCTCMFYFQMAKRCQHMRCCQHIGCIILLGN